MKPAKTGTVERRSQGTNGADGGAEPESWVEPEEIKELGDWAGPAETKEDRYGDRLDMSPGNLH